MAKVDPRLERAAVQARYNDINRYCTIDPWHSFTAAVVQQELETHWRSLTSTPKRAILNAGAGGKALNLRPCTTINLDISARPISHMPRALVASVEALPFTNDTLDAVVCVGSVINYCDAAIVISEFSRVLRPSGLLVLEFESSQSAELITQDAFARSAAVAETFYAYQPEAVWVFSPRYIYNLLAAANFEVRRRVPIHVLSPWALLLLRSIRVAVTLAHLDHLTKHFPVLTRCASNFLIFSEKRT
jgi:SAM-dependent methyltransferase